MPPMPPMPPPPGIGRSASFFGASAIMASVVTSKAGDGGRVLQRGADDLHRIDDARASCRTYSLGLGVEAERLRLVLGDLADHDRALHPEFAAICRAGAWSALRTILMPAWIGVRAH